MWIELHRTDGCYEYEVMVNTNRIAYVEKNRFKDGTHIVFEAGNAMDVTESYEKVTLYL